MNSRSPVKTDFIALKETKKSKPLVQNFDKVSTREVSSVPKKLRESIEKWTKNENDLVGYANTTKFFSSILFLKIQYRTSSNVCIAERRGQEIGV